MKVHAYYKPWCRWAWQHFGKAPQTSFSDDLQKVTCSDCLLAYCKEAEEQDTPPKIKELALSLFKQRLSQLTVKSTSI